MKSPKCIVAVCGVLDCVHNECGRCYNEVIALDKSGECLCFEEKKERMQMPINTAPSSSEISSTNGRDVIDRIDIYNDFGLED